MPSTLAVVDAATVQFAVEAVGSAALDSAADAVLSTALDAALADGEEAGASLQLDLNALDLDALDLEASTAALLGDSPEDAVAAGAGDVAAGAASKMLLSGAAKSLSGIPGGCGQQQQQRHGCERCCPSHAAGRMQAQARRQTGSRRPASPLPRAGTGLLRNVAARLADGLSGALSSQLAGKLGGSVADKVASGAVDLAGQTATDVVEGVVKDVLTSAAEG